METNDLKKYLKEIITLESAAFEYSQYVSTAEKSTVFHEPQKKVFSKPVPGKKAEIDSAAYSRDIELTNKRYAKYILWFFGAFFPLSLLCWILIMLNIVSIKVSLLIFFAVTGIGIFIGEKILGRRKGELFTITQNYTRIVANENNKKEQEYKTYMKQYNKNVSDAEEIYKTECEKEQQRCERAKGVLEILKTEFGQIVSVLNKFYDMDVIFPKYRNLSAVCSFYEYLMTERCSELTGPNGAYNLYETERTMGHIVNAVDNIANMTAEALNMMKENQYYYYTEMRAINDHLDVFTHQLNELLTSGANANDYFLQISDHTKALTYDSASILANMHI